jgi:hypothetical protein
MEWLFSPTPPTPAGGIGYVQAEITTAASRTTQAPLESRGYVPAAAVATLEARGFIQSAPETQMEAKATLQAPAVSPEESLSPTATGQAAVPVAWLLQASGQETLQAEWATPLLQQRQAAIEVLTRAFLAQIPSVEALATTPAGRALPWEIALRLVAVTPISVEKILKLESLEAIALQAQILLEARLQLGAAGAHQFEYLSQRTVQRTASTELVAPAAAAAAIAAEVTLAAEAVYPAEAEVLRRVRAPGRVPLESSRPGVPSPAAGLVNARAVLVVPRDGSGVLLVQRK